MSGVGEQRGVGQAVVLGASGVSKRYGGVLALNSVTMSVHRGEAVALLGANGAGKSTLVKILTGALRPDTGTAIVEGRTRSFRSVAEAREFGIGYVPQELSLAPDLTVAENVMAAGWYRRRGFVATKSSVAAVREVCERVGLNLDPHTPVRRTGPAEQRLLMIARALLRNPTTLVLDEPTAAVPARESDRILDVLVKLRDRGISILYISHRMNEIQRLCDREIVLKGGNLVMEAPVNATTVGKAIDIGMRNSSEPPVPAPQSSVRPSPRRAGAPVLSCRRLSTAAVSEVSFQVQPGEIVGLAGLLGSGKTEVLRAIVGVDKLLGGRVEVLGKAVKFRSPSDALRAGVGLLPEDRKTQGGVLGLSVSENLVLANIPSGPGGVLRSRRERVVAAEAIERYGIKCNSPTMPLQTLSGGNQQKVILARLLLSGAQLLLLDEPTAGIDVVAKREILGLVQAAVQEGRGAVMASSDLAELCEVCDRVLVLEHGRVRHRVDRGVTAPELARLCGEREVLHSHP